MRNIVIDKRSCFAGRILPLLPDIAFLHRLADVAAAETLPRFRSRLSVANKLASGFDPVTEADRAAETAIRRLITAHFPDHGILGEEHGADGIDRDFVWVIDPIDGTRAFISGLPVWGTLIGLYHQGRAVMGVMDQPFTRERFTGGPEGGRYQGPDGDMALGVRDCGSVSAATLFTTSPRIFCDATGPVFERLESRVTLSRYGCDCYAFALLAAGHVDIVVEAGLKPYDIGGLIAPIEQAGGIVTTWQGGRAEQGGNIIACGSKAVHEEALALLNG
jgi:myo-inositol-1(or 4)-monophosphatase